jgi:hypothetical protein
MAAGGYITIAESGPGGQAIAEVALEPRELVGGVDIFNERVVYYTYGYSSSGGSVVKYEIRSLPLNGLARNAAQPVNLYSVVQPQDNVFTAAAPWSMGAGLLAYTRQGQLYARTYDGSIELPLERGVASFFHFDAYGNVVTLR